MAKGGNAKNKAIHAKLGVHAGSAPMSPKKGKVKIALGKKALDNFAYKIESIGPGGKVTSTKYGGNPASYGKLK